MLAKHTHLDREKAIVLQERVKCDISIGVEGGLVAANMTLKFMESNRELQPTSL
jgi:hypothetical protein